MVDVIWDCETAGLSATPEAFVCCCINHNGKKEIYYSRKEAWDRIIEIGKKSENRREVVNLYGHNAVYEFLTIADLSDKEITIYSDNNPLIVAYGKKREYIKFLDTYAIFPMSLKDLGRIIGLEKGEISEEFKDTNESVAVLRRKIKHNINNMRDYLYRDTEIPMLALNMLKSKLRDEGVNLMRLCTISQIAIGYVINKLKEDESLTNSNFWYNKKLREIYRTKFRHEIHAAYRGPKVECYELGIHCKDPMKYKKAREKSVEVHEEDLDYLDCNSLYPYSISMMRMPNLRTERKINDPLSKYDLSYILSKIGVTRCMLKNVSCDRGLIPVRTPMGNYYPQIGKYMVGTYTNLELQEAIQEGYEIITVEWSVLWDEMANPFKKIYTRLYELRMSGNEFDKLFYKSILNNSIGKMGSYRPAREYVVDDIKNAEMYLDRNYDVIEAKGSKYLYVKEIEDTEMKPYYMPIIPCLVNAYARVKEYRDLKTFNKKDVVYVDTDSFIYKTGRKHGLKIGEKMGEYKEVCMKKEAIMFGKKTYMIGDEIKISGMRKRGITPELFENGYVESMKMVTLRSSNAENKAGTFNKEGRDLYVQYHNAKEIRDMMTETNVYIDDDIDDVEVYLPYIKSINK